MFKPKRLSYPNDFIQTKHTAELPLWAVPTALSLDAPTVAVLWQWLFAKSFELTLSWHESTLLFATVWLIYVADRLLDSRSLDLSKEHTFRHAFYARHQSYMLALWLVVFAVVALLALGLLEMSMLSIGASLVLLCLGYGIGVHTAMAKKIFQVISKEWLVGLLFALGTSLIIWLKAPSFKLALMTLCFAFLCSLNCLLISLWEKDIDHTQGSLSKAQTLPSLSTHLRTSLLIYIGLTILSVYNQAFYSAPMLSGLGLLGLWYGAKRVPGLFSTERLRILADVALMSPLFFL